MEVVNEVSVSRPEQIAAMLEPGPDGPIYMVNLLKFKDHAEYEDGRETDLTGRAAYNLYGAAVMSRTFPSVRSRSYGMKSPSPSIRIGPRSWRCRRLRSGRRPQCIELLASLGN